MKIYDPSFVQTISRKFCRLFVLSLLLFFSHPLYAQYFGRNKAQYKSFKYKVYQTPHLELYHYFKGDSILNELARKSERWHALHQEIFRDTFMVRNPVIFYANHADFQQTTVISGIIGVGTGGVTEGFRNRVVMPVMESNAQTDHVLGHELVHAFQYNLLKTGDSTSLNSVVNLPLWMVEGLAEYMSLGRIDTHTAMWMRDAVLNDDVPSLYDLTMNPQYFPYRYGHAFWAFVGGIYGDTIIKPLFAETAKTGFELAVENIFGFDATLLGEKWDASLKNYYLPFIKHASDSVIGRKLISEENAGEMNMSPVISPDGQYIIFLSEKELFTIDLFIANVQTGKVLRRITSTKQTEHIDALSFIESAGTWSPDSKKFAFVAYEKGKNRLVVVDLITGETTKQIEIPGVPAFSHPSWSPDGNQIVVTGLVDGQSDLFLYNFKTFEVKKLTNDPFSNLQPSWSNNGQYIIFSSDELSMTNPKQENKYTLNISILNITNNEVSNLPFFPGADNLNPVYAANDSSVFFLSNRDGFRNLYNYSLASKKIYRLTNYVTGVSGLTHLSSAMSVASKSDKIAYSYYLKNQYNIYCADKDEFQYTEVNADSVDFRAGILPPYPAPGLDIIESNLKSTNKYKSYPTDSFKRVAYRPQFQLDYIGNATIGMATSSFGTGLGGGIDMLFSDILSYNRAFLSLAVSGSIYDIAGAAAWLNQKRPFNYGASLSHIPFQSAGLSYEVDTLTYKGELVQVDNFILHLLRTFEDKFSAFSFYPISPIKRIEVGATFIRYSFRLERINNYYLSGYKIGEAKEKLQAPQGFNIVQFNTAYVGDNSFFGLASPMKGHRYRFQLEKYMGGIDMYAGLADYRKYYFTRPFSFAFRGYHYGRYGKDEENPILFPLFLGYPTLVRGYNANFFFRDQDETESVIKIDQLVGTRIMVTNTEVRLPLTGPERIAVIKSDYFLSELAFFIDGGVAWSAKNRSIFNGDQIDLVQRVPVFSTGLSLRVNLFGYLVVEPYYAVPFLTTGIINRGVWGLNLAPGW